MAKNKIGERKKAPQWRGEADEKIFIGWVSAFLGFGFLLLIAFIVLTFLA